MNSEQVELAIKNALKHAAAVVVQDDEEYNQAVALVDSKSFEKEAEKLLKNFKKEATEESMKAVDDFYNSEDYNKYQKAVENLYFNMSEVILPYIEMFSLEKGNLN
jgi:hypothetical protein